MSRTRTLVLASVAALALVAGGAAVGSAATNASSSGPAGRTSSDLLDPAAFETALGTWAGETDDRAIQPGQQDRRDRFRHRAAGRMLHGEVVLLGRDDVPVTVALQHGEVTAVDASSVTVKSSDGYERTWALDDTTRYASPGEGGMGMRMMAGEATRTDVKVGTTVRLAGAVTDGKATARFVGIAPADGDAA